jgi:hypothetical protein
MLSTPALCPAPAGAASRKSGSHLVSFLTSITGSRNDVRKPLKAPSNRTRTSRPRGQALKYRASQRIAIPEMPDGTHYEELRRHIGKLRKRNLRDS